MDSCCDAITIWSHSAYAVYRCWMRYTARWQLWLVYASYWLVVCLCEMTLWYTITVCRTGSRCNSMYGSTVCKPASRRFFPRDAMHKRGLCRQFCVSVTFRLANRPGMAGIVPKLTHGVLCPGRGSFCPGNVKIDHRPWIYGCSLMSVLYLYCVRQSHTTWLDFSVMSLINEVLISQWHYTQVKSSRVWLTNTIQSNANLAAERLHRSHCAVRVTPVQRVPVDWLRTGLTQARPHNAAAEEAWPRWRCYGELSTCV